MDLLPCPFCGSPGVVYDDGEDCIACCLSDQCQCMPASVGNKTLEEAAHKWNTRIALHAAPDGWQTVPKQWTSEMAHAGYEVHKNEQIQCAECGEIYAAMIAAAPKVTP